MGVKINYRAYYQDEVFEIRKKASIGILDLGVGLEPVVTSAKWIPGISFISNQFIQGRI